MNITSEQAYSILGVVGDLVLSKDGSVCLAYLVENPEPYSLDEDRLDERHDSFYLALRDMPRDTFYHKQDAFIETEYDPAVHGFTDSFISNAEADHFRGRKYVEHYSLLSFTLTGLGSLGKAYTANPYSFKENLAKEDLIKIDEFLDAVSTMEGILKNLFETEIRRLATDELKHYIFRFVNGFYDDGGLRDLRFEKNLSIGASTGCFFAISDENYLPDSFSTLVDDDTIKSPNQKLLAGRFEKLGLHLNINHVVNQIIYFKGHDVLLAELDRRVLHHGQHKSFNADIKMSHQRLEQYQSEVRENKDLLCKAHFNIMLWSEDLPKLEAAEKEVISEIKKKGFNFYIPSFEGLYNIFLGSIIGRENKLDKRFFFPSNLNVALALTLNYGKYRDDPTGVLFTDRIFRIPKRVDLWAGGRKKLPARNGIVIASTGGGKSATVQNIAYQFLEQGVKTIIVEFGSSFKIMTQLYPGKSTLIEYKVDSPLGINPFYIDSVSVLDNDKIKTLSELILRYWRKKTHDVDPNLYVALQKIIRDYYRSTDQGHNFRGFYTYVKDNFKEIVERIEVPEKYFDIDSFVHICSEFMPGGVYENVSAPNTEAEKRIRENDLIVFELSQVKKDPFLVSIIMTALFDTIDNKILSDRSKKGVLIFDEYAETQSLHDYFSGDDIHSTVAFAYQKIRKENGAIYTIIQSPVQLPDNEYTKGIIANTQLLYVLPTTETVYDAIIESFHIKQPAHIALMKSIQYEFQVKNPFNEVFIRFMDNYAVVHKLEFSREKFLSFQTDGEVWNEIQNNYNSYGDIPKSILKFMTDKNEKINKKLLNRYAPDLSQR